MYLMILIIYFITFQCMNNHKFNHMHLHSAQWIDAPTHLHDYMFKLCLCRCDNTILHNFANIHSPSIVRSCVCVFMPGIWWGRLLLVFAVYVPWYKSLSPSIYEKGQKTTTTPSRIPIRSNPNRKSTPVQIEVSSPLLVPSTTISIDHISNNNDNKSKSTHPVSPLELQAIQ